MNVHDLFQVLGPKCVLPQHTAIIDVRSPEEFADSHIPGSLNLPFDTIGDHAEKLQSYQKIYFYCRVGQRALKAYHILQAFNLPADLQVIVPTGMPDWEAAGYPVSRG